MGILLASHDGKRYSTVMRIIARNKLVAFWVRHPETEASLKHWHEVALAAAWQSPLEVVTDFSKSEISQRRASAVRGGRR
jgi:mRNA interferase HigB